MKGTLVAALVVMIAIGGSVILYAAWTSARHAANTTTSSNPGSNWKVVKSNLTVDFNANCIFGPCPTGPWPTKNVELIDYLGNYYYGINFTYYSNGQPVKHTIWFTNSTVFCISPASGYNLCPAHPAQSLFLTLNDASASVTNPSLGLSLELRLAANLNEGSLRVTVEEVNTLGNVNNISAADDWRVPTSNLRGPYETSMVGYAIYRGYYDINNFTSGTPLPLTEIGSSSSCSPCPLPTYYLFQPMSDNATTSPGSMFWFISSRSMLINFTENVSGFWTSSSNFTAFSAGPFTVVALDQWGQAAILHFDVKGSGE
jgi:hypothetical protein